MSESKSRWGSLLSGAVAGLESKLDIILAEDDQASARSRLADEAAKKPKIEKDKPLKVDQDSRASSKSRTNDKLQARLAKAIARSSDSPAPSSKAPSESASPHAQSPALNPTIPRTSIDSQSELRPESRAQPELDPVTESGAQVDAGTIDSDSATVDVVRPSSDSLGPSLDSVQQSNITSNTDATVERNVSDQEAAQKVKEQAEEIHQHLEKIDRLHANVAYLSTQLYDTASSTAATAKDGSIEKKELDKDVKIAQLLEEGGKLSKIEEKLRVDLKYLRSRLQEEKGINGDLSKRLEKAENEIRDLRIAAQSTESREKAANDRLGALSAVERELESVKLEKSDALKEVHRFRKLLEDAERRADDADRQAQSKKLQEQMRIVAELNDELSNARIEKRLVEDRVKSEMQDIKEEHSRQLEKAKVSDIELKAEVQNLEAKLEVFRLRSEEVSANTATDSQAKLLRQIETLQTQYALASDNWQGIEASLNTRVTTLEKERDELAKREADARKKARELNSKARKFEEEIESANDLNSSQEIEITQLKASLSKLEIRLNAAEKNANDAHEDLERERKDFESSIQSRLEEERHKWRSEIGSGPGSPLHHDASPNNFLRADSSISLNQRKVSATDMGSSVRRSHTGRGHPADLSVLMPNFADQGKAPNGRRGLAYPTGFAGPVRTPTDTSLVSRPDSASVAATSPPVPLNGNPPPIVPVADDLPTPSTMAADVDDDRDTMRSSPQRTAAELISVSTAGAGPSVQLVERMSATVRRLEMEKAASREEMARLLAQRDEARDEVVTLMREVDTVRETTEKLGNVEKDMNDMKSRYEAALEMIGEKSEECEELKNDVMDLKKIYRELVESTLK